jgi:PAS domain S-box-containing protein
MKNLLLLKWFRDIPIARKLYFTVGVMAMLIGVELFALFFSINTLSAVRAYVGGEGLWSKAQKDALYALQKYGHTHNEADYQQFREFMKVPLGDGKTRVELMKLQPDLEAARQGFIEGRNHPEDVDGMIKLFRRFNKIYYIHKAIIIWSEAEPFAMQLLGIGEQLHLEINGASPSQEKIEALINGIDPINKNLTALEDDFSFTLGEGSRWLEGVVLKLLFCIALSVEITGLLLAISVSRNIQKGLSEILAAAHAFATGNLKARAKVYSKDEIGVLAESYNQMSEKLTQNIAELERAEKQSRELLGSLQKSDANLRTIFNNTDTAYVLLDADLQVLSFNQLGKNWAQEQMSIALKENENLISLLPESDRQKAMEMMLCVLDGNGVEFEHPYSKKDGTRGCSYIRLYAVRNSQKDIFGLFIAASDITARKNAEAEIIALNNSLEKKVQQRTRELEAANQELESFSYSVSHDLRAPLRRLSGFSQLLMKNYYQKLDGEGRQFLSLITENTKRMSSLIDGLLKLARFERASLDKSEVDLGEMVNKVVEEIKLGDNQVKAIIKTQELGSAECDPVLMKQVWVNLISNGLKYSSKKENPTIEIGSEIVEGNRLYYVRDNGAGFDMKYYDELFGTFKRLHAEEEFEGTGVGLAITNRIIKKHGGKIWAEAEINIGATFYFTLNSGVNFNNSFYRKVARRGEA